MAKEAFNRKWSIFYRPLEKELKKILVKCFAWSVALYGAETWILRQSEEKRLEAFEMWIWRRMERVKWTDRIRNEAVLEREDEVNEIRKSILSRLRKSHNSGRLHNVLLFDDARNCRGYIRVAENSDSVNFRNAFSTLRINTEACNSKIIYRYVVMTLNPRLYSRILTSFSCFPCSTDFCAKDSAVRMMNLTLSSELEYLEGHEIERLSSLRSEFADTLVGLCKEKHISVTSAKYIEYLESSSLQLKDAIGVIDSLLQKQVPEPVGEAVH
ncbi:hypothetical protein ANN_18299 [Periplaneta americana]|uniref:Uncharacterized protein n=1 Tax=Periplaneta americana TaxID=6978 RepID=A0ABQ8SNV5_PERAM|nr:hypothetical protein ANN_18299 [Periplaneta americana]